MRTEHHIANTPEFRKELRALATAVRHSRIANNLTLAQVAREIGCSLQQISGIEHGSSCSLSVYRALCRLLNGGRGMMGE